jgi:hypothetical protein
MEVVEFEDASSFLATTEGFLLGQRGRELPDGRDSPVPGYETVRSEAFAGGCTG